jgi:hypothetical protein
MHAALGDFHVRSTGKVDCGQGGCVGYGPAAAGDKLVVGELAIELGEKAVAQLGDCEENVNSMSPYSRLGSSPREPPLLDSAA